MAFIFIRKPNSTCIHITHYHDHQCFVFYSLFNPTTKKAEPPLRKLQNRLNPLVMAEFDLKDTILTRLGENYDLHDKYVNRTLVKVQRTIGFDKV